MNNTQTTAPIDNQASVHNSPSLMESLAPILLMIFAFYFLMIRPQQKRETKKKAMLSNLKKGDKIVTLSGVIGVVHKIIDDNEVSIEVAEGVQIKVLKSSIASLWEKSVPQVSNSVKEKKAKAKDKN